MPVHHPQDMNGAFAQAFNTRDIDRLLALYEPDAVLQGDPSGPVCRGVQAIQPVLVALLSVPGTMQSLNRVCLPQGELALLRADWSIVDASAVHASGSSMELIRRQADGTWRYVIDHASGASLPGLAA